MPSFLSLPNEILHQIIQESQVGTLEALSLSCRLLHLLASKRLAQHLQRKRDYSTVAIGRTQGSAWNGDEKMKGVHPIIALRNFLLDEENIPYARTLVVGNPQDDHDEGRDDPNESEEAKVDKREIEKITDELKDRILAKAFEIHHRFCTECDDGSNCIVTRQWSDFELYSQLSWEQAACLLFTLLNELRTIRIVGGLGRGQRPGDFIYEYGFHCVETIFEPVMDGTLDPTRPIPIENLSEVNIQGFSVDWPLDFHGYEDYWISPSIRAIKGRFLSSRSNGCFAHEASESLSFPISSLAFYQCAIDAESIYDHIRYIKALETFIYSYEACQRYQSPKWEPLSIVEVLQRFAAKSLAHLELTSAATLDNSNLAQDKCYLGNLRCFEMLETIRVETMLLYKDPMLYLHREVNHKAASHESKESGGVTDEWAGGKYFFEIVVDLDKLVDILPASVKSLTLVGALSPQEASRMFAGMAALKEELVPNLREIIVEDSSFPEGDMREYFQGVGIDFKVGHRALGS
ncbi:hypothetical protein MMC28_005823 [Mycoblastus sanguinarius]|nr:hypothetical protein [Mycoblastus sanguinarius]